MIESIAILVAAKEPDNVVNETINNLISDQQVMATTDGLFRIFTVLSTAASLSLYFFKYLFGFLFQIIVYIVSPFIWIIQFCWHQFITKPFDLLLYVLHMLYPVLMFCFAAICCGIFIGGCAGFAAEAFSSILITATWGPQPKPAPEEEELLLEQPPQEEEETVPTFNSHIDSRSSSISSKGKEPFNSHWRDSFSSSSSIPSSHPALIRRMKLSSTEDEERPKMKSRTNSWEWEEEDF